MLGLGFEFLDVTESRNQGELLVLYLGDCGVKLLFVFLYSLNPVFANCLEGLLEECVFFLVNLVVYWLGL